MGKNQKGFGLVELLLVVAAIMLIGLAAWVVANRNSAYEKPAENPQPQSTSNANQTITDQQPETTVLVSEELSNKTFGVPLDAVEAYCKEQNLDCKIKLLYEDGTYAKIYDTGADHVGTQPGNDYYVITDEGDGWKFNFLADAGCDTGTDHPALATYCSQKEN